MDCFQNWLIVFSIICITLADKNIHKNNRVGKSHRSGVRIPKFEFFIYNDAGAMVKQYLTVREIQQLLLQQSLRLGPGF